MTRVAIIVLNWKTPKLTIDTVNSLLNISHKNFTYDIFIVDNGSPDDSVSQFTSIFGHNKSVSICETKSNLGYVEGNNYGIKISLEQKYDYSLIINSDVIVK
jgi:GT2 family glycosyltransferase